MRFPRDTYGRISIGATWFGVGIRGRSLTIKLIRRDGDKELWWCERRFGDDSSPHHNAISYHSNYQAARKENIYWLGKTTRMKRIK